MHGLHGCLQLAFEMSCLARQPFPCLSCYSSDLVCQLQDARTTLAVFFEIVSGSKGSVDPGPSGVGQFYVQCKTTYMHWDGSLRCRVFTFTRQCALL